MSRRLSKILFFLTFLLLVPQIAQAGFLDSLSYCTWNGSCDLKDIAFGFSSLIKYLLGAMGAVALLYFVWGGVQWLISGGNAERVQRGKQIMINTVFAIILAFGSYLIIEFFVNDVLNADQFGIEQTEFVFSCEGQPAGTGCGGNKQCTGVLETQPTWSEKCLGVCQMEGLITTGYKRLGECTKVIRPPWKEVPSWADSGCPPTEVCVYMPS